MVGEWKKLLHKDVEDEFSHTRQRKKSQKGAKRQADVFLALTGKTFSECSSAHLDVPSASGRDNETKTGDAFRRSHRRIRLAKEYRLFSD